MMIGMKIKYIKVSGKSFTKIQKCMITFFTTMVEKEFKYCCENYKTLPVVIDRGQGVYVWDTDGKQYIDFISGLSANVLGHCNPDLIKVLHEQSTILHHTSRTVRTNILEEYCKRLSKYTGFDKVLPMNTGVEAADTACKLARKWGYTKKNIPKNQAEIVFAANNFWGRSLAAISTSTNFEEYNNYGPFMPGFRNIPFNDLEQLKETLQNPNVCAFMVEPIQGDAGIIIPDDGYLKGIRNLCTEHNVLWIADEIQTGLGRTGMRLAVDYEDVKPDIITLGKSLGGGLLPVSATLADDAVMSVIEQGTHGSTFGGNALASKVAQRVIEILEEEDIPKKAFESGKLLRDFLSSHLSSNIVTEVRGKGLLNAIQIHKNYDAWAICVKLAENGVLVKIARNNAIRLIPPLNINEIEIMQACGIIVNTLNSFDK